MAIARANAQRLGLERVADRLRLRRERESRRALRVVADALTACGYSVGHAPAEECVTLSADPSLLPSSSRAETWPAHTTAASPTRAGPA